ncbi:MAG: 16S rRNA (cytosine(967)-C(5))-methyltransferase RsmB, partial [Candidatus Binataceae bacterium]
QQQRAFADILLGHRLGAFAPNDRRLITQLVLGTITWQGRLDYELARLCSHPLQNLAPELAIILRMGLHQIRTLTRIPPHAVVDTGVRLARQCGGETARAAGMVNAVLRRALRQHMPLPDRAADELEYLSITYSHPRWLVERLVQWFGHEAEALLSANNSAASNVIRLNLARAPATVIAQRLTREGFEISNGALEETLILKEAPPADSSAYRDGMFTPQSEASQMVARMLAPARGATVVDCAAAPGGKSTHLAELVGFAGKVIACDLNLAGIRKIRHLAARLGHRNIYLARADCADAIPLRQDSFDYVLLDAPCTGSGTMREHPEIRWRLVATDFSRMARLQRAMLDNAAHLMRVGGAVVYSVCSIASQEGPEVVRDFLASHRGFKLDNSPPVPAAMRDTLAGDGSMRTRPNRGGRDGFYAARLVRLT